MSSPAGRLVIVATPIGNLGDLSPRALEVLTHADVIYCEDTRRTRAMCTAMGVAAAGSRLRSLNEHNEAERIAAVVALVGSGATVGLVSDAGTPLISDPGQRLVKALTEAGLTVTTVPGASAVTGALTVSGLATDRYCFEGFVPRKGQDRRQRLDAIGVEGRPSVIFEAPGRLRALLEDLAEVCGPERSVAVVRELTKVHEEVWRSTLAEAIEHFADEIKGEIVVVVAGHVAVHSVSDEEISSALAAARADGTTVRDAVAAVSSMLGVGRRRVYELANQRAD